MAYPTGNATHDAAIIASENTKAMAYATALAAFGGVPANYATYKAAVLAADVAHFRAGLASAKLNNCGLTTWIVALKEFDGGA